MSAESLPAPEGVMIHPSADVSPAAQVGSGTKIWQQVQVREGAAVGAECSLGKGCYVDFDVRIGDRCKLQNGVSVFHGFDVEDGVFLGPGAMLLNDHVPRAVNPEGSLKTDADWRVSKGRIEYGASVGGGVVVLPGVRVGQYAMVGAGAVVTSDVPPYGIVYGNPARLRGFACPCGHRLRAAGPLEDGVAAKDQKFSCDACARVVPIPAESLELLRRNFGNHH